MRRRAAQPGGGGARPEPDGGALAPTPTPGTPVGDFGEMIGGQRFVLRVSAVRNLEHKLTVCKEVARGRTQPQGRDGRVSQTGAL